MEEEFDGPAGITASGDAEADVSLGLPGYEETAIARGGLRSGRGAYREALLGGEPHQVAPRFERAWAELGAG